jgi:two-component system phosphate regulon sensor histidine kinase PhoR
MSWSKLFWKLFLVYVVLTAVGMFFLALINTHFREAQNRKQVERRMSDVAAVLQDQVCDSWDDEADNNRLQEIVNRVKKTKQMRATVVDSAGKVLADSEEIAADMENHLERPEIVQAREHASGLSERTSPTQEIPLLYYATRCERRGQILGYLRLSVPTSLLRENNRQQRHTSASAMLIVSLVAIAGTYWAAKHILGPVSELTDAAQRLAKGEDVEPLTLTSSDELGTLADTFHDMSRQIRTREGQLRDTASLLSTVLEGMTEGVLAVDIEENILFANPIARSVLGVPTEKVAGKSLYEVTRNPVIRETVSKTMSHSAPGNDHEVIEICSDSAPNRAFVLNAARLAGNPCPGVVVVFHDVSDMRQLEQMRQEFVANVSHELKTPLSCIRAYAETLREGAIDDASVNRHFLAQIEDQSERLNDLIMDMLRLARIESGQQGFDITSVPLADVVEISIQSHMAGATERHVRIQCDPELPEINVRADEEGLQQILDNLIDNAVKYSLRDGNVTIAWITSGEDAVISIKDEGIGIRPEDQKRVFERFYRVDKARSRELGSTGLGLSIAKHMARAFGGGVSLESEYGRGTTFWVRLPLA